MSRIQLLFPPKRIDLFYFLKEDKRNSYLMLDDDTDNYYEKIKKENSFIKAMHYWEDYSCPKQLISKINPDKIIFGEVFDLKQIALCIYANSKNIPTFFIDHGIYDIAEKYEKSHAALEGAILRNKIRKLGTSFIKIIKNRFFYFSVITSVSKKNLITYLKFPLYSFIFSSFRALNKLPFDERTPVNYILFCKKNISHVDQLYTIANKKIFLTGFPYYDNYFSFKSVQNKYIVYIEHPFLEDSDLGWNKEYHEEIANNLNSFAVKKQIKVYVKLHPRSNIENWKKYNFNTKFIEVIQFGNFDDIYFNANLILSYSSSLLIGFLSAKKNVVLLGWHPSPQIVGINFFEMGLCHISLEINELEEKYNYWIKNNICEINIDSYKRFILNYNYPFDGNAAKRILNIINDV